MRRSWKRASVASILFLAACGSPPPPEVPVAQPAKVAAPAETPPADNGPVAEPRNLVLVARWQKPVGGIDEVLKAFGATVSLEKLLHDEGGAEAKVFDLDASVDGALILDPESTEDDPKPLGAVSVPLKSFEETQALIEKGKDNRTTNLRPGLVRITEEKKSAVVCDLVAAAPGKAPAARLVCGEHAKDLDVLRDWLVRGLPESEPAPKGFSAVLRAAPFKDRYMGRLRKEASKLEEQAKRTLTQQNVSDPELLAAPSIVLDESLRFVEDVDRLELRAGFDPAGPRAVAGGSLRFAGRSSWVTQVLTDANDHAGPAPEIFWRLPKDAYSATFARGADPRLFEGVRRVLHKAVTEALGRVPLPGPDKAAIEAFIDGAPRAGGVWASSTGWIPVKAKPAGKGAPRDEIADAKSTITSAVGWHVWGVDAPATEYVAWAKQGLDLYNRGVKLVKTFADSGHKTGPKAKAASKDEWIDMIPKITSTTSPAGWPKGTVAFDVTFPVNGELADLLSTRKIGKKKELEEKGPLKDIARKEPPKAKKPAGSMTVRLAIVPDGDRTFLGFSADLELLRKHMLATISGAPREGTLASREDLADLKQPGETWGGFLSFDQILSNLEETLIRESPDKAADIKAVIASLPNKGRTPVLLVGSGATGAAPSLTAEFRFQQGTLADMTGLVGFFLSPRGRELLKKH